MNFLDKAQKIVDSEEFLNLIDPQIHREEMIKFLAKHLEEAFEDGIIVDFPDTEDTFGFR